MTFEKLCKDIKNIYEDNKHLPRKNSIKHNSIQKEIKELAEEYGYSGSIEFFVPDYSGGKVGYIDVVWYKNNNPVIAFEVDSSVRPKSLSKLLTFKGAKVWVYYGGNIDKFERTVKDIDRKSEINYIVL